MRDRPRAAVRGAIARRRAPADGARRGCGVRAVDSDRRRRICACAQPRVSWQGSADRRVVVLAVRGSASRTGIPGAGASGSPLAPAPGTALGDVVISVDTARRQAQRLAVTPATRMRTLLVHGLLHLLGYDHERSPAEARRMFARRARTSRRASACGRSARRAADKARGAGAVKKMTARDLQMPSAAMLTHFTRAGKTSSALDNLVAILRDGVIRGRPGWCAKGVPSYACSTCRCVICTRCLTGAIVAAMSLSGSRSRNAMLSGRARGRSSICRGVEAENLLAPGERWRVVALELERKTRH